MKLAIFGSRKLVDNTEVKDYLDTYIKTMEVTTVLMGGAAGVQDTVKEHLEGKVDLITFKPWHLIDTKLDFTTKLFFMRNRQIIDNSQRVLAFIKVGEEDSEVDKAVEFARKRGKQVDVIEII